MCLIHQIGGAFKQRPEELSKQISQSAADLIKRSFDEIDPARLVDHHVHIAGIGIGGTSAFVNRKMLTWSHPFHRLKYKVYMSSAGVESEAKADQQFVSRLAALISSITNHGKHRILGFDKNYARDGAVNLEKT